MQDWRNQKPHGIGLGFRRKNAVTICLYVIFTGGGGLVLVLSWRNQKSFGKGLCLRMPSMDNILPFYGQYFTVHIGPELNTMLVNLA